MRPPPIPTEAFNYPSPAESRRSEPLPGIPVAGTRRRRQRSTCQVAAATTRPPSRRRPTFLPRILAPGMLGWWEWCCRSLYRRAGANFCRSRDSRISSTRRWGRWRS
ncbi:unnamed protein product [Linum tenue]|uniref:Uncharacterized protein n=1 Tax=Linum tenue TaxID=586396 RepID=A0AAV0MNN9_9ROSI|nr:unnamed protein product [Linum tenue]